MASSSGQRKSFFPKADAAVLSSIRRPPPTYPKTVWPIYDPDNVDKPIGPWPSDVEKFFYPPPNEAYAPASIPDKPMCGSDRYLRAFLAKDERFRLSMLWYYTRDIFKENEFLSGLQEKIYLAQESTGWEFAVIGILDVNFYIRLAAIGLPLAILPRGETICAHTVTQPPGSVFLLPDMMEDWRFRDAPYVESGGLRAYAGAPLRLQNESGDCVSLGSLCVASSTSQMPLTKPQQHTLARLADWVVSDIVQCARARRQRARRQMTELISMAQAATVDAVSDEPVLEILRTTYPDAIISLQSSKADHVEIEGRDPIVLSDLQDGLWEDIDYMDEFIANSNQQDLPSTRVIRVMAAECESVSGPSLLMVASKDFRLVFDDVDSWFIQTCAAMISQMWHKRLLAEVMKEKEKFLRGISHQLRTPIHGILGSVELLAEELKAHRLLAFPEAIPEANLAEPSTYLDTIKAAGRDLISIVNSMITLNRWTDIAMTTRHYAVHTIDELETQLANEILKITSGDTRYRASVFFNQDLPPDCDSLQIDLHLLQDSLLPLIVNAIQNTSEGIVLVTISMRSDTKELIVDVEDTGCGIEVDDQQRIFELYEKIGLNSTGAGLGLTIASKFATLLQGSVALISSDVGRGSHFRATFREIQCASSPLISPPLAPRLKSIPSRFYNMLSSPDGVSLCGHFTRFLTRHGFTSTETMEDCFAILDFVPDLEQRRAYLSQIPADRVAICLIPTQAGEAYAPDTSNNVIYVSGPFLTSTMSSALEQADRILSEIKTTRAHPFPSDEPLITIPKIDKGPTADEDTSCMVDSPNSKGQSAHLPADNMVDSRSDIIVPVTQQLNAAAPRESTIIVPIPSTVTSCPRPAVLLVDDNVVNLRILQIYCRKRGLPYYSATDGKQAVEMFSRHQSLSTTGEVPAIELIFMDLQMPVCDGLEATRQIRSLEKQNEWRKSILFIVTGQDSATDMTTAEGAGADDYFVKPVGLKVLDRNVKKYFPAFKVD